MAIKPEIKARLEAVMGTRDAPIAPPSFTSETAMVAAAKSIDARMVSKAYRQEYIATAAAALARGEISNPMTILRTMMNSADSDLARIAAAKALMPYCVVPLPVIIEDDRPRPAFGKKLGTVLSEVLPELLRLNDAQQQ